MTSKPCPHPEKRRYSSRADAVAVIADMYRVGRGNPDLGAYECVCGAIHIGNSQRRLHKRIKASLSAGRARRRSRRNRRR